MSGCLKSLSYLFLTNAHTDTLINWPNVFDNVVFFLGLSSKVPDECELTDSETENLYEVPVGPRSNYPDVKTTVI